MCRCRRKLSNQSLLNPSKTELHNYAQAMILGLIAKKILPLSMAPVLVDLAKELAKDPKVLQNLTMDRTISSYKLVYGLGETLTKRTMEKLKKTPFSLNMDGATYTNNKHVLIILCNYYDEDERQLASVKVVTVDTESLYVVIENLFGENEIPWTNLVSVLMHSCAVMRGCKNGLEKRLRDKKAPHLLDIDGDVCHHMHNGSKKFCAPFEGWVEELMTKNHIDNKYYNDLRDYLLEICRLFVCVGFYVTSTVL